MRTTGALMALTALCLMFSGCAAMLSNMGPGRNVSARMATAWGCDHDQVMRSATEASAAIEPGQFFIPQVGWSACTTLARTGAPHDVDHQQTEHGRYATWWYHPSRTEAHMVSLEYQREGFWRVTYVGW